MVISQPPGNNPSYYYRASPTLPQLLNASRDTLCSIHAITTIRVTHRNGAIKHIFYTNQIHGGIISRCSLFILSLRNALHLVKILLQIFLYEDFPSTLTLHASVGCISLQNASRTALCYITNTIK